MDEDEYSGEEELVSRAPSVEDLVALCRHLNASETKYLVVGGFAIRGAGYGRETMGLDLIIATDLENEAKVYKALESLPDQAVLQLSPGEVSQYTVVRVGDEICVDLMASACGIGYEEASQDQIIRLIDGVPIPFASPRMLYRMKVNTHREKDRGDLQFLREYYPEVLLP